MSGGKLSFVVGGEAPENGEWFEIAGGDVELQVRDVTPARERALRVSVGLPAHAPTDEKLDDAAAEKLFAARIDWQLQGWRGRIFGPDGKPLPVTLENKVALLAEHEPIARNVKRCSEQAYVLRLMREGRHMGELQASSDGGANIPGTDATGAPVTAGASTTTSAAG